MIDHTYEDKDYDMIELEILSREIKTAMKNNMNVNIHITKPMKISARPIRLNINV